MSWVPAAKKMPTDDPIADFTPVSMVGTFGFSWFVHRRVPANTIGRRVAPSHANPGKLNCGTGNATGILATAQFAALQTLDVAHIPHMGDGPLILDPVAARVQFAIMSLRSKKGH